MKQETVQNLIQQNRRFYNQFAEDFSATRGRLQPGVSKLIPSIPKDAHLLDLGCGNGEFWVKLVENGHTGTYTGLDNSQGLISAAKKRNQAPKTGKFLIRDISFPYWHEGLPGLFDFITAFATLHHIPSKALHRSILTVIHSLIKPGGQFIHSNWQFLNSPRWRARIQPWSKIGMKPEDLEPGDYLLDWRRGGTGYRYVHHFEEDELTQLAAATGFEIEASYYSDGKEGNLGLYQVWRRTV